MAGLSIICVFNDVGVRTECLDRSIEAYAGDADIEYIAVDNTGHAFPSAGAALNHGARQARHDLLAFVHQDVYLHAIDRLIEAGAALTHGSWGLLGANGVAADGENLGRLRDRAQVLGAHRSAPADVDSLDEVLFLATRRQVLDDPLTEQPELAWHAYAVEYSLRLRSAGRRVGALDLGITHNSLTINLDRLDVAHRFVGQAYPDALPIHTTCGTIGSAKAWWRRFKVVRDHGWRLRWLRHSWLAAKVRRRITAPVVLSDIRHEIDLLPFSSESPLHLFNLDRSGGLAAYAPQVVRLTRYGRPVVMRVAGSMPELLAQLAELPLDARLLVVGVGLDDLGVLGSRCADRSLLVGIHPAEIWVLGGAATRELPAEWSRPEAVPLGFGATRRS